MSASTNTARTGEPNTTASFNTKSLPTANLNGIGLTPPRAAASIRAPSQTNFDQSDTAESLCGPGVG